MVQELLDGLINWVLNTLINIIVNIIIKPVVTLVYNLVLALVSFYFYQVAVTLLSVVDFITDMFRMVAGLAPGLKITDLTNFFTNKKYDNNYQGDTNDILIKVVTSTEVLTMFASMLAVGLFLMIMCTLMATIKQEFNLQKSNKKGEVLNKLFRTAFNMIMVPTVALLGMYAANFFLGLVDAATGGGDKTTISGRIFAAACGNAFYSNDDAFMVPLTDPTSCAVYGSLNGVTALINEYIYMVFDTTIDFSFFDGALSSLLGGRSPVEAESPSLQKNNVLDGYVAGAVIYAESAPPPGQYVRVYYNATQVSRDFTAVRINYVLIFFSSIAVIKCLAQASFGLVARFYKCAALFILLPGVLGISPLDDGSAYKGWKKEFVKQVIGAYGVIIAVNLYLEMMGVFANIKMEYTPTNHNQDFFNASSVASSAMSMLMTDVYLADAILKIVFIVVGALMLDKFAATISSLIGGENLASIGKGLMGEVGRTASTSARTGLSFGKAGAVVAYKGVRKVSTGIASRVQEFQGAKQARQDYISGQLKARFGTDQISDVLSEREGDDAWTERKIKYFDKMKARATKEYDEKAKKDKQDKKIAAKAAAKSRRAFKKQAKSAINKGMGMSGILAPRTRGFVKRELLDDAMKKFEGGDADVLSSDSFKEKLSHSSELAHEEAGRNMKVGVRLGKNAIKSLMPGAKLFEETKSGIDSQRDKNKGNSDVDRDIIEAYEKVLKEGDEEEAKKKFENLIEYNTMKTVPAVLDSMQAGINNAYASIMSEFESLIKNVDVKKDQGADISSMIEQFISRYDLSGVKYDVNDLSSVKNNIEAAIKVQFDIQGVQQQIESIRKETNSKKVIRGIQQMLDKYKDNMMMNAELLKAIQQIQGGMDSNKKYK